MSSDRKNQARKKKYATKSGEFRHSDGDRRRRPTVNPKKIMGQKRVRQTFDGGIPIEEPPSIETDFLA